MTETADPHLVVLRGGTRDGQSATLATGVTRLLAASEAPGMIDVYEPTDETESLPGNQRPAHVYAFVGQEPATELSPEALHVPFRR